MKRLDDLDLKRKSDAEFTGEKYTSKFSGKFTLPGTEQEVDKLQTELSAQINDAMTRTRKQLLENFDEEVYEKLRINMASSKEFRTRYEQILMNLTEYVLGSNAEFKSDQSSFTLKQNPFVNIVDIPSGVYNNPDTHSRAIATTKR